MQLECEEYPLELHLPPQAYRQARDILKEYNISNAGPIIAICPGSGDSWGGSADFKRWPVENFSQLCRKILSELKCSVIILGSQSEEGVCRKVLENAPGVVNLCGKLELDVFCALVELCDMMVTNDGGPLHISQALHKKSVAFFGPVDENVYGAYPDRSNVVTFVSAQDCRPCYRAFKFKGCAKDKRCLRDIDADKVFLAVKDLIGEVKP